MDVTCVLSALFFCVSNILGIVVAVKDGNSESFDYDLWTQLDPDYLKQQWDHRRQIQQLVMPAGIINALAWFTFTIPVIQIAWIMSRGGKRQVGVHAAMAVLAFAGSMSELLSRLFLVGLFNTSVWVESQFNLESWTAENDNIGWRVLEITTLITNGLIVWVDAFEWLALFSILSLIYYSVGTQLPEKRVLSKCWAGFGLFIGLLSFIDFSSDVLRLQAWTTFSAFAVAISVFNMVIMLPIWLLILAWQLPKARPEYSEEDEDAFMTQEPQEAAPTRHQLPVMN